MATQYGHFDDSRREFIISDPKLPWPWINYLGTENFFSLISATAGGYSFYKDAKFRRITRYRYNGVPADNGVGAPETGSVKSIVNANMSADEIRKHLREQDAKMAEKRRRR